MTTGDRMDDLGAELRRWAEESELSGVVMVTAGDAVVHAAASGMADRARQIPNTVATRFGIASGTKGFTALTIMRLVERGDLALTTTARALLGDDLPLVDDAVTVEHLLAHRSGIGDYLDEAVVEDFEVWTFPLPPSAFTDTEAYLPALEGHAQAFAPGTAFAYCNGGYVVLALLAERATGIPFADLVATQVLAPAGLVDTAFLRTDRLPPDAAVGYLEDGRPNDANLPVVGSGDGGIFTTATDVARLWRALLGGRIVQPATVAELLRPRHVPADGTERYGLGFWLHPTTDVVVLEGCDAGVSFRSLHDPARQLTATVISNSTDGAWPVARRLRTIGGGTER